VIGKINFQPDNIEVPQGHQKDSGRYHNSFRGYGWKPEYIPPAIKRDTNEGHPRSTYIFIQANNGKVTWLYDLPNGDYLITLESGDSDEAQGPQTIVVEGQEIFKNVTSEKGEYLKVTDLPVTITDGQLDITIGPNTGNSLLNYVEIRRP
jgi:hypothetical protein